MSVYNIGVLSLLEHLGHLIQWPYPGGGMEKGEDNMHQHSWRRTRSWKKVLVRQNLS